MTLEVQGRGSAKPQTRRAFFPKRDDLQAPAGVRTGGLAFFHRLQVGVLHEQSGGLLLGQQRIPCAFVNGLPGIVHLDDIIV